MAEFRGSRVSNHVVFPAIQKFVSPKLCSRTSRLGPTGHGPETSFAEFSGRTGTRQGRSVSM